MANSPDKPPSLPPASRRLLLTVRVCALLSVVLIAGIGLVLGFRGRDWFPPSGVSASYLIILWLYREKATKVGLWLAAATGTFVFFPAWVYAVWRILDLHRYVATTAPSALMLAEAAAPIALILTQGAMVGGATALTCRMAREAGTAKPLWAAAVVVALGCGSGFLGFVALFASGPLP